MDNEVLELLNIIFTPSQYLPDLWNGILDIITQLIVVQITSIDHFKHPTEKLVAE